MSDETTYPTYTIGQLAEAAGVTPRTVRYYTAEGLLPAPDNRGRYASYGETHRLRLLLIGRLKEALLPLNAIRAQVTRLNDEQITALLVSSDRETNASGTDEPLPEILPADPDSLQTARLLRARSAGKAPGTVSDNKGSLDPAGFVAQVLAASPATIPPFPAENAERAVWEASEGTEQAEVPLPPFSRRRVVLIVSPRLAPISEELPALPSASGYADPEDNPVAETWKRVRLAPGVELHFRLPDSPDACEHLDRLIAETRLLFHSLEP